MSAARTSPGIFFDGKTSVRHAVTVELTPAALVASSEAGQELVRWPYEELDHLASHDGIFRLAHLGSDSPERLEIRDPAFAAAIDELSVIVDRTGTSERRGRRKVVAWSIAAVASLMAVAVFGVPALATRLAPIIPYSVERKLGQAVDQQVRGMFGGKLNGKPFECGGLPGEEAGKAALDKLVTKMSATASLGFPLQVAVARDPLVNAIALPGGQVYLFRGLIEKSNSIDEVAGVLAHEIGHVAHRDGTRSVLQAAGLSFLFGMVLGDFVGGGATIIAARTILQLSYSREVERAADIYAVDVASRSGGNPRALGTMLSRIAGSGDPSMRILQNHPVTKERVELIERLAPSAATAMPAPLLTAAEWAAFKRICG